MNFETTRPRNMRNDLPATHLDVIVHLIVQFFSANFAEKISQEMVPFQSTCSISKAWTL